MTYCLHRKRKRVNNVQHQHTPTCWVDFDAHWRVWKLTFWATRFQWKTRSKLECHAFVPFPCKRFDLDTFSNIKIIVANIYFLYNKIIGWCVYVYDVCVAWVRGREGSDGCVCVCVCVWFTQIADQKVEENHQCSHHHHQHYRNRRLSSSSRWHNTQRWEREKGMKRVTKDLIWREWMTGVLSKVSSNRCAF